MIDHEFKPYADMPDLCVVELSETGETCNRPREDHGIQTYADLAAFADNEYGDANLIRAARGAEALVNFAERMGEDEFETTLADLLTDLHHTADVLGLDFDLAVYRAHRHHEAERAGVL